MQRLQDWMIEHGLTDSDVAEEVGCSRVQVSRVRRSVCKPSPDLAMKLEKLTGIAWHEFIAERVPRKRKKSQPAPAPEGAA
jgi:transcriptional regulator with XRE-family HTH domain